MSHANGPTAMEPLLTYQEAASKLGLPYFKIQRAARQGLLPTYRLLNGRRYVKVSDIQSRMTVN
ncbi:MAG: helix-turn-helix domain-containing protein [Xanthobacteraceae bacterium]